MDETGSKSRCLADLNASPRRRRVALNRLASTLSPKFGYRVARITTVLCLMSTIDVSAQFTMPAPQATSPASTPATSVTPVPGTVSQQAMSQIGQSRTAAARRDYQTAVGLFRQAAATSAKEPAFTAELNKLRSELVALGIDAQLLAMPQTMPTALPSTGTNATPLQALGNIAAQPLPSGAPMSAADRKREALRLIVTGRAALDRGDVTTAYQFAKQAESLRVAESEFAPGEPRAWQLVLDSESAARRAGIDVSIIQQATALTPAGQNSSMVQQAGGVSTQSSPISQSVFNSPINGANTTIQQVQNLSPLSSGNIGESLYREGLDALTSGELEKARAKFVEAWKYESQLDLATRAQLKDKLTLLQPARLPEASATDDPATMTPIQKADLESKQKTARLYREVTTELANAEKASKDEPLNVLDQLEGLRRRIEGADVDEAAKQAMSAMVAKAAAEQKKYVDANRADIELNLQNEQVRTDMENAAAQESRVDDEVSALVETFNELMRDRRFPEAEVVAKEVAELKPGSSIATSLFQKSRMGTRLMMNQEITDAKELGVVDNLLDIERSAITMDPNRPYAMPDAKTWQTLSAMRSKRDGEIRGTAAEQEIARKLDTPISVKYRNRPLNEVVEELEAMSGVDIVLDNRALSAVRVTPDTPISLELNNSIPMKSALNLILGELDLTYVIEHDVLSITSQEAKRSKVWTKTYRVTDLVTPIPNFTSSYEDGLAGALKAAYQMADRRADVQIMPVSMTDMGNGMANNMKPSQLSPNMLGQYHPMGAQSTFGGPPQRGAALGGGSFADFDSLMQLIQTTVSPDTWEALGGPSTMAPYQQNLSLVISTTSDVHDQIADLLESLRRLQNLQITIEVRFITLSDSFFEQIGIDFDLQFDDNATQIPEDDTGPGVTIGINAGGVPTQDFDIRLENSNAVSPPFGGIVSGGSQLGFAILSDIEAFFFLQASQGDNRNNIMQAPKVTLFDGQIATIQDTTSRPFVTSITPVVGDFAVAQQPVIVVLNEGTQLNVQGVVSDDKRYVRLTLVPFFSEIGEVNTFTYEGRRRRNTSSQTRADTNGDGVIDQNDDSQSDTEDDVIEGSTVQLPTFATTSVSTTVSVPDGGTILLGGIKRLAEGRAERGTPFLSKVPYVSRLFRNVAVGRDARSLMLMVTPRIIIQEEEEVAQTGFEASR